MDMITSPSLRALQPIAQAVRRLAPSGLALLLMGLALAPPALGQTTPTPEGTVITNQATASFTDANNNTYANVSGSVSVTVGFAAGVDVVAGAATASPASPSTGNTLPFTLNNVGNGHDTLSVALNVSDATVVENVTYRFNAADYATLAALNTALAAADVPAGGGLVVTVVYDLAAGEANAPSTLTLTATSRRDPSVSDADQTTVTAPLAGSVAVTPDGAQNLKKLPSNGTSYSFDFTVANSMNSSLDFNLVASTTGSAISVTSVAGTAGTSAVLTGLAAGDSRQVTVVYTVGDLPAGTADTLTLTATASTDASLSDQGTADLRVIRPALAVTKEAYRDDRTTAIAADGTVSPGEYIQYRVTVQNSGTAPADSVAVTDALSTDVLYDSSAGDSGTPAWAMAESGGTLTATLPSSLAAGTTRYFWIRVRVK